MFKDRGNGTYNFRCPYCGDSLKSKHKCRGNIFENHETRTMWYYCHNCGVSVSFSKFLKDNAFDLYERHKFDTFAETTGYNTPSKVLDIPQTPVIRPTPLYTKIISKMFKLSECPDKLIKAKEYIMGRKIPSKHFNKIYVVERLSDIAPFIPEFKKFVDDPVKYKPFLDSSMICFPHFLPDGSFNYAQMRSYEDTVDKGRRFIKFKLDDNENLMTLYGIDRINFNNKVIIVEGHIDSLCVTNAIAMGTATSRVIEIINKLKPFGLRDKHDVTLALDNDYRTNVDILKFLKKSIDDDIDVVIYDDEFSQFKDFNDALKGGYSIDDIDEYIKKRTFRGLSAKLELHRQLNIK